MERSVRTTALLVKNYPLGEQHRGVVLVTPDLGVVRATAFGSRNPKGKLGALSSPFRHLEVWLYYQPISENWKLSDAQEIHGLESTRNDILKYYTACLWAETALVSHLGGDSRGAYKTFLEGLLLLERWPQEAVRALNLHYCLRWLTFLGLPWKNFEEGGSKTTHQDLDIVVEDNVLSWVETAGELPLGESEPPCIDNAVESLVFRRLREALGRELLTLKSWANIVPSGR